MPEGRPSAQRVTVRRTLRASSIGNDTETGRRRRRQRPCVAKFIRADVIAATVRTFYAEDIGCDEADTRAGVLRLTPRLKAEVSGSWIDEHWICPEEVLRGAGSATPIEEVRPIF